MYSIFKLQWTHNVLGGIRMAEPYLKNRTRFTSSLKNELVPIFDQLSKESRIPKSRLLDEAIEDLIKKHTPETSDKQNK